MSPPGSDVIRRRAFLKGLLGVLLAGLVTSGYGIGVEALLRLKIARWQVRPEGWKARPVKVVMVADIHAGGPWMTAARVAGIVARANALGGDLILLMGDYKADYVTQTHQVWPEEIAPILAGLRAPLGVYAIIGNHDWWDDPEAMAGHTLVTRAERALTAAGIPVLVNTAVKLDGFWLAAVDSEVAYGWPRRRARDRRRDIIRTLGIANDGAPVIFAAHEPDVFGDYRPAALTLSGHTHGGQINLFGWMPIVPSRFGSRYAYGHIREAGRDLVVSGGLGCSGLPIRLGRPPELTVVEISA